jgi:hypothetical protein
MDAPPKSVASKPVAGWPISSEERYVRSKSSVSITGDTWFDITVVRDPVRLEGAGQLDIDRRVVQRQAWDVAEVLGVERPERRTVLDGTGGNCKIGLALTGSLDLAIQGGCSRRVALAKGR